MTDKQQQERNEMAACIAHIDQYVKGPIETLRPRIIRLFEEGLDGKTIIDALIARRHDKETAKTLGEIDHDFLTLEDIKVIENQMGLNDDTDENREHWLEKFQSKRAKYLCPKCGYSGNAEFFRYPVGEGIIGCYHCNHYGYEKYFSRAWTPEEQAAYEAAEAAKAAKFEQESKARAELEAKRKAFWDDIRADAVKALEQIDRYQWLELEGEDEERYKFDPNEESANFHKIHADAMSMLADLIIQPLKEGFPLRYPWDEIVEFFKRNLEASKDGETSPLDEFERCAVKFRRESANIRRGYEQNS